MSDKFGYNHVVTWTSAGSVDSKGKISNRYNDSDNIFAHIIVQS